MSGSSEKPPGTMEGPPESAGSLKETCEQNKSQLDTLKEIMLRNKQSLKKKEEDVQEYAKKISKYKSRSKTSRRSSESTSSPSETGLKPKPETTEESEDVVDDISQAKTPKAKSTLLLKKFAEGRKIYEQHCKESIESKKIAEEKVEALLQQLDQTPAIPLHPVLVTSQKSHPVMEVSYIQDKDKEIKELHNKITNLQATIVDLQENLKEKDSVIDSKTKAITLMSADLSMKGKTTLDTLEDTKDEMRSMQENFVLLETSLRSKNENLLEQLQERNSRISELEESVQSFEEQVKAQDNRSTLESLADTKDAMQSMQENFILIETSLKAKNDNLLKQLEEREIKLAEADAKILKLESGMGIVREPEEQDFSYRIERLEQANRKLEDEKFELQKSIAEMQDRILASESLNGSGVIMEKDNRIAELENLIEELKRSNQLLQEESKAELEKQLAEVTLKNEEVSNQVVELERLVHRLETERNDLASKIPDESQKDSEKVVKLTKEMEDLNKGMIKLKAQHKSKLKNLQRQLESFKKVSDTNAELVKLGNQVTLLEEEKASAGDWKETIADLEGKVSSQAKEIQSHIEAIATLENQKLDLMQELHSVKQELSGLEAEIAESENLRVTAEMKIVDLEEQLESSHKLNVESVSESERLEFQKQLDALVQENEKLTQKISKSEEKGTSDVGSTDSFVKAGSNIDSTESFDTLNDADKNDLLKRIDALSRENSELLLKLSRFEEKGSDTGSTESFEKIPEHPESSSKLEILTRENNELVIKLTKLEERFANLDVNKSEDSGHEEEIGRLEGRLQVLVQENSELMAEIAKLNEKMLVVTDEKIALHSQIETLVTSYNQQKEEFIKAEERIALLESASNKNVEDHEHDEKIQQLEAQIQTLMDEKNQMIIKVAELEKKSEELLEKNQKLMENIQELLEKNEKLTETNRELTKNNEELTVNLEKTTSEREQLLIQAESTPVETVPEVESPREDENITITALENEIEEHRKLIEEQKNLIEDMRTKLAEKEEVLATQSQEISQYEAADLDIKSLQKELKDSASALEEWKLKCNEMEEKTVALDAGKRSIEELLASLQDENKILLEDGKQKNEVIDSLKQDLAMAVKKFEKQLEQYTNTITSKDNQVEELKQILGSKDSELHDKYSRIQNDTAAIQRLQNELTTCRDNLYQREVSLTNLSEEVEIWKENTNKTRHELMIARDEIVDLNARLETSKSAEEFDNMVQQLSDKDMSANELEKKLLEQAAVIDTLEAHIDNLSTESKELYTRLMNAENEATASMKANENLLTNITSLENEKTSVVKQLTGLQELFDNNTKYMDDLKVELQNSYRTLEQLKLKHSEDIDLQNRRLEDLLVELSEKEKQVTECVAEDAKGALEAKVSELEGKLAETEQKVQTQLEKMKKYVAVIKKKTAHNEELEAKLTEVEEKWTTEKDEKETKNSRIQILESYILETENQISSLKDKLLQIETEKKELLESKDVIIEELSQELLQTRTELHGTKENLTVTMAQLTDVQEAKNEIISELGVKLSQIQIELNASTVTIANLRSELKASEEIIITDLSEQLTQTQSALNESRIIINSMKSEALNIETTNNKQISDLEEQLSRTQNELYQVNDNLTSMEGELNELREAKENARELGVRMEFMEHKDIEQRAMINSLQAENGFLQSKQIQINEKLENVEKESEERKVLLEKMQKEKEIEETDMHSDDPEVACGRCGQCKNHVQALEARLRERDAEVENLDNELSNSRENCRQLEDYMRRYQSEAQSFPEYNDLVRHYNLVSVNEDLQTKFDQTLKKNKELAECIKSLQELNATLQERINAVENELSQGKEATAKLDNVNTLYSELVTKFETKEIEIEAVHKEFQEVKETNEMLESNLRSQILQLQSEKEELLEKYNSLSKKIAQTEEKSEKEIHQAENVLREKREVHDHAPPLFDAFKAFGMVEQTSEDNQLELQRLESVISAKNELNDELTNEITRLKNQITEDSLSAQNAQERLTNELLETRRKLNSVNEELNNLGAQLHMQLAGSEDPFESASKNEEIVTLQEALSYAKMTLAATDDEIRSLKNLLESKSLAIDALEAEKSRFEAQLNDLVIEKREAERIVNHIIAIADDRINESRTFGDTEASGQLSSIEGLSKVEFKISEILSELDFLKSERDQLLASHEVYRTKVLELENEIKYASDGNRVQELEERVSKILSERDILQLEANELTRTMDDLKEFYDMKIRELKATLNATLQERDRLMDQVKPQVDAREMEVLKEGMIEVDTAEKLDIEDEGWGWSPEEARLAEEQHAMPVLIPNNEIQLQARVAELEDRIKDLETESAKLLEENKAAQIKSAKYVKKLKEYKVQYENLKLQLKSQKSTGFMDLDMAIEEELKSQISGLEKDLREAREEYAKTVAEKEYLVKRIDILQAANERFVEMKEKQDMEVEVYQIRNKELANKVAALENHFQTRRSSIENNEDVSTSQADDTDQNSQEPEERHELQRQQPDQVQEQQQQDQGHNQLQEEHQQALADLGKYKEEINELKENLDALAAENDQLQQLLEEQRNKRLATEGIVAKCSEDCVTKMNELKDINTELQGSYSKLVEEHDLLRKQYEQCLMDANDQVQTMRQNSDLLRTELTEKNAEFQETLSKLTEKLRVTLIEKEQLVDKLGSETCEDTAKVTEVLNSRVEEVDNLRKELQDHETFRSQMEASFQENMRSFSDSLQDKQNKIEELTKEIEEKDRELEQQKSIYSMSQDLIQKHGLELHNKEQELQSLSLRCTEAETAVENYIKDLQARNERITNMQKEINHLQNLLKEKEIALATMEQEVFEKQSALVQFEDELEQSTAKIQVQSAKLTDTLGQIASLQSSLTDREEMLQQCMQDMERQKSQFIRKEADLERLISNLHSELDTTKQQLSRLEEALEERNTIVENLTKKIEANTVEAQLEHVPSQNATASHALPLFTMGGVDEVDKLKEELEAKNSEIEHLQYALDQNTYPGIIQKLQDNLNVVYNEKDQLEKSLMVSIEDLRVELKSREEEIRLLRQQMEVEQCDVMHKEEVKLMTTEKNSEQNVIMKLQNELHAKEQHINELKYVITEKETRLQQMSLESSDDFDQLSNELYAKQQDIEKLKVTVSELHKEISGLKDLEKLSTEDRAVVAKLSSEKEQIRQDAVEALEVKLRGKEDEIDNLKRQLSIQNNQLTETLSLKEQEVESLRRQIDQSIMDRNDLVHRAEIQLEERNRRLAEISITKDAEIHNLNVQIREKDARIEELLTLSQEEEKQLTDLRIQLEVQEQQMNGLKVQLDEKVQEYDLLQHALKRHVQKIDAGGDYSSSAVLQEGSEVSPNEMDLALYMLHQRDVRCEELTHELMQLLEERDTLQLRLSNEIRVNEDLHRYTAASSSPKKDVNSGDVTVEHPSPSKSEGPVEIAKEALSSPIGEDKKALAQKLSQLRTVDQGRDVRLRDERELRHTQQMSLLAHKDVLSTLPPEAAAKIVNANYTLSRDVQSQSSVLLNWLWGKSTPKVVHM